MDDGKKEPERWSTSERQPNCSSSRTEEDLRAHFESEFQEAKKEIQDIVRIAFGLATPPEIKISLEREEISGEAEVWARKRGYFHEGRVPITLEPTITVNIPLVDRRGQTVLRPTQLMEDVVKSIRLGVGLEEYDPQRRTTCFPLKGRNDLFYCNWMFYCLDRRREDTWWPPFIYLPRLSSVGATMYEALDTETWCDLGIWSWKSTRLENSLESRANS